MPPSPDPVLGIGDLESWDRPGTGLAVLGQPIGHSLSPAMHNAALRALAREDPRFSTWRYHRFEIAPGDLVPALRLLHGRGFQGLNLTIPHKVAAFAQVDVDPEAVPVGAVNALRRSAGGWAGFNTDGYGLACGLKETLGFDLAGAQVLLLGAGGAARGAALECLARGCAGLWISNRTREHRDALLQSLKPSSKGIPLAGIDLTASGAPLPSGLIVINATSAGLRPSDPPPLELGRIPRPAGVYDMIYNPPETPLLRQARMLGLPSGNGLSMLVHQGARSLELWTGVPAARTAPTMRSAAERAAAEGAR